MTDADRVRAMLLAIIDPPKPRKPIRQRRLEAGLLQRELAREAGVSLRTIGMLEHGESLPHALQLVEAALRRLEATNT